MTHSQLGDKPIFPPWHFHQWRAVDDRVRGGASVSHLDSIELDRNDYDLQDASISVAEQGDGKGKGKIIGARFWGHLDISTLGGAGFASQSHIFGPLPLHLPPITFKGIKLAVLPDPHQSTSESSKPSTPSEYTLVLKTTLRTRPPKNPKTPPSPEPANVTYEANFSPYPPHHGKSQPSTAEGELKKGKDGKISPRHLAIPFEHFTPTYRGRPVPPSDPKYVPLRSENIYEISLMCRSGFGKQEGDFGAVVLGVWGWKKGQDDGDDEVDEKAGALLPSGDAVASWWGWVSSWWSWVRSWWGGEGRILLDEKV